MKKILIIEDDLGISGSLKLYLENSGFEVILYSTGEKAIEFIKETLPDLIILDLNLPGKDGIEITKELRETDNTPIVMLTARTSELDKIRGLEIGADDYVAKPFSPRELLARINTIIRRISGLESASNLIKIFDLEVDLEKKIVTKNNEILPLTSNEFEILKKLIEEKGGVVSRETIMKDIIGYDNYVYDRTIDTHMKNLRKKIGSSDYITTIRGIGYRLNINLKN
ncbi:hypothetical protein BLD25_03130 [Candidatus Gracilibacteria bacterium GN02-872]|nr:hypothetical protein BLD25_03130 [Candidatus Gracilibacteria bacterium GN02-872]RKW21191.1 MAG: DNA-binding response regulator [Candidatus Gracilibacteria bacterium]